MTAPPEGWISTTIGAVAEVNPGPSIEAPQDDEVVSFIPMAACEAETGRLDASRVRPFGELRKKSFRHFQEGDVVMAKITPSMENGKAALAKGLVGGQAFGSTEFHVLRPRPDLDPRYILHYILQSGFRADAARQMTGTAGQLRVPADFVRSAPIPLPPIEEQQQIVEAIEEQFSRLDAGVDSLQRTKRNLARLRASVLKAAVEGRLSGGDSNARQSNSLPNAWQWEVLGDLALLIRNGVFVSRPGSDPTGTPIFRISAVRPLSLHVDDLRYTNDLDAQAIEKYTVSAGDLLFTRYSGQPEYVGACAVVPPGAPSALHPDKLIRVVVDPSKALSSYVAIASSAGRSLDFIRSRRRTTAGQTGIGGRDLRQLPIPLPPLAVQRRIVAEVDRQFSIIDSMAKIIDAGLERAMMLRQSILSKAFQGNLGRASSPR